MKNKYIQATLSLFLVILLIMAQNALAAAAANPQETLSCTAPYSGPAFYVNAQTGDNTYNGSASCPFKTIQKAADSVSAYAGNQVFVHEGIYRENLDLVTSGVAYRAYPGETPVIDGSQVVGTWIQPSGEVYYTTTLPDDVMGSPIMVQIVIAEDKLFDPVNSLAELTSNTFYQDGFTLNAQFEPGLNPNTAAVGVVKLIEDYNEPDTVTITGNDILFSGFEVRFAAGDGIFALDANNLIITNCTIKFANLRGILIWRGQGNTVNQCIIHSNVLSNYPRLVNRLSSWGQGISFFSGSDGTVTNNIVSKNHGEGIGTYGGWGQQATQRITIQGNTVFDSWGVNIYIDGASHVSVNRNLIYGSGDYPKVDPDHEDTYHQNIPIGIQLAKEMDRLPYPGDLTNITVSNNIIIDCFAGITFWHNEINSGLLNVQVINNTLFNHNDTMDLSWTGVSIDNSDYHQNSSFTNNLIYQSRGNLLESNGSLDQIIFKYNGWDHAYDSGYSLFSIEGTSYTFAEWCSMMGKGEGAIFTSPGFVDGTGLVPGHYQLLPTSPMRDQGTNTETSEDYNGTLRPVGIAYDIGAFEFGWLIFTPLLLH
jgi:parallel beta-helix repeat protein